MSEWLEGDRDCGLWRMDNAVAGTDEGGRGAVRVNRRICGDRPDQRLLFRFAALQRRVDQDIDERTVLADRVAGRGIVRSSSDGLCNPGDAKGGGDPRGEVRTTMMTTIAGASAPAVPRCDARA